MEIINLFPTPVAHLQLPDKYAELIPVLNSQPIYPEETTGKNAEEMKIYGTRSINSYILDLPELSSLKQYLIQKIEIFSKDILKFDPKFKYRITQSWITVKYPHQSHREHNHPNSFISGVFYYGDYDPTYTPGITFHRLSSPAMNTPSYSLPYSTQEQVNEVSQVPLPTPPGTLYLFPSWLGHSVPTNTTKYPRTSVAFNSIPKGTLGDEMALTELKPE